MQKNEAETRSYLIDPVLREKGYDWPYLRMERPAAIEPVGHKGKRKSGKGTVDYLICIDNEEGKPMPVAVLEAKAEHEDAMKGIGQGRGYKTCENLEVKYIFSSNGHRYAKFNKFDGLLTGPFPLADFPDHQRTTECYARHTGIDLNEPEAKLLFMQDSPAYADKR